MGTKLTRTKLQIADDRRQMAHYYFDEHMRQVDIAVRLNERPDVDYKLSQTMVSYDLRVVQQEWLRQRTENNASNKAEELQKIAYLESEYYAAWIRSRSKRQRQREEKSSAKGTKARSKMTITSDEPVGDPRFLTGVQCCIDLRCKILGLFNPTNSVQTDANWEFTLPPIRVVLGDRTIQIISSNWG